MSKTCLSSEASPLSSIWVFLFYSLPPSTPSSSPAPVTFSLYFAPSIIIPLSGVAGCKEKKKRKKEKTGLHVERNPTFSYWNTKPTAVKCSSKTQTTATHIFLTFILSGESMCALCLTHCCTHSQWDLPPAAPGVCCWSMNRSPAACAFLQSIKTCSTFKFFQSRQLVHKTDYPWQIKMFLGVNPGHE